jgi:hypothetical protein
MHLVQQRNTTSPASTVVSGLDRQFARLAKKALSIPELLALTVQRQHLRLAPDGLDADNIIHADILPAWWA